MTTPCLKGAILVSFLYLCQLNLDLYETFNESSWGTILLSQLVISGVLLHNGYYKTWGSPIYQEMHLSLQILPVQILAIFLVSGIIQYPLNWLDSLTQHIVFSPKSEPSLEEHDLIIWCMHGGVWIQYLMLASLHALTTIFKERPGKQRCPEVSSAPTTTVADTAIFGIVEGFSFSFFISQMHLNILFFWLSPTLV